MTADSKTPLEHVGDVLNQLKEMRHYSKTNVEHLTTQWLLFDGELKKLKQAGAIEALMTRQSELHDALEKQIEALEELVVELTPKEEEGESAARARLRRAAEAGRALALRRAVPARGTDEQVRRHRSRQRLELAGRRLRTAGCRPGPRARGGRRRPRWRSARVACA